MERMDIMRRVMRRVMVIVMGIVVYYQENYGDR